MQRLLAVCLLLVASCSRAGAQGGPGSADAAAQAQALLSLPEAASNWDEATAALAGAPWQDGTDPCGSPPWKGVTCQDGSGRVTQLALPGLGLQGMLPANLSDLPFLEVLNLSNNTFRGSLPRAWLLPETFVALRVADLHDNELSGVLSRDLVLLASTTILLGANELAGSLPTSLSSPTLEELDVSENALTGLLPPAWGDKTALPRLSRIAIAGNQIRGPIPDPQWTSVGFQAPCTLLARPGNDASINAYKEPGLCGPLLALNPQLYDPELLEDPTQDVMIDKPQIGALGNSTTLVVAHAGLFERGTLVTITNTLGTCMLPCSSLPGGNAPASATIQSNLFDVTWRQQVSSQDLLRLNPGAALLAPGAAVALPCYPPGKGLAPAYFGGSVAYLQFTGGNQRPGSAGLEGAMAASGTNDHLPNCNDFDGFYEGSEDLVFEGNATANSSSLQLVQPVYLFVDLEATCQARARTAGCSVSVIVLTAGNAMRNVSLYVGNDSSAVQANSLVAQGLSLAPRETVAVPVAGVQGHYVIVWAGSLDQGNLSISDFQVYARETNAAAYKPVTSDGGGASLGTLVDASPATCAILNDDPDHSGRAVATVDLGYQGVVGAVAVLTGPSVPPGTFARVLVKASAEQTLQDAPACDRRGLSLQPGAWAAVACNVTGRYIVLEVPLNGTASIELCDLQAGLTLAPLVDSGTNGGSSGDGGGSSGLSGGAIAGIVVGSIAGAAALAGGAWWALKRHSSSQQAVAGGAASLGKSSDAATDAELGPSGSGPPLAPGSSASRHAPSATSSRGQSAYGSFASSGPVVTPRAASIGRDASRHGSEGGDQAATDLSKLPPGFNTVSSSDFTLIRSLGAGSFGEVWLARWLDTAVAVKMLTLGSGGTANATASIQQRSALAGLQHEAQLMARLRHPNVCQYLGACSEPPSLVMEYCSKRSVDYVAKQLTWARLLNMALDAAKGMLYLHSITPSPIAHRDLKSANLLVDSQWHVADFNLSRALEASTTASTLFITNPRWLAPEILSGHPGQLPADVWAFGTVLWELITGKLPFEGMNAFQIITLVQQHVHANSHGSGLVTPPADEVPAGPSPAYRDYCSLMHDCWAVDPVGRPSFALIVQRLRSMLALEVRQHQQRARQSMGAAPSGGVATPSPWRSASLGGASFAGDRASAPGAMLAAPSPARSRDGVPAAGVAPASASDEVAAQAAAFPRAGSRSLDSTSPFAALASVSRQPSTPTPGTTDGSSGDKTPQRQGSVPPQR